MKSITLAASFLVLALAGCIRNSGPARAEALSRVSELTSAATFFTLMVETGWQEPDSVKTAEYQDTLARLERARADARNSDATPEDIKLAEEKGAMEAAMNHRFRTGASRSPREVNERIEKERAEIEAENLLEAARTATRRAIRAGENAEKIRAWERAQSEFPAQ